GVGDRVEAEGVSGVDHQASLEIRCPPNVDNATYGGCGRVHDPYRRVHSLQPLCAHGRRGVKLPYLVGGGYIDFESAKYVLFVFYIGNPRARDFAWGRRRRVVATVKTLSGFGDGFVAKYPGGGCRRVAAEPPTQ